MDKDYDDDSWYKPLTGKGIFFSTRQKTSARYRVISRRDVLKNQGLTKTWQSYHWSATASMQKIRQSLQLDLFEKRDLMALPRGDLVRDDKPHDDQLAWIWALTG